MKIDKKLVPFLKQSVAPTVISLTVIVSYLCDLEGIAHTCSIWYPEAMWVLFLILWFTNFMAYRNFWVCEKLIDRINADDLNYADYDVILGRFWVWDIEKFRITKK